MANLRATPEYEAIFRSSVHDTLENTLLSVKSSTFKNIWNFILYIELKMPFADTDMRYKDISFKDVSQKD